MTRGNAKIEKRNRVLEQLKIEYVSIDELRPNEYNPNRQSTDEFELLCRSIREDGFTQPVIVIKDTKVIVDGEHRWRAARHLSQEDPTLRNIPVVFVDMNEEQRRISTLRHNRARGTEDVDLVGAVFRDFRELGVLDWAQDSLMVDDVEMERLLSDLPAPEALAGTVFSEAWAPTTLDDDSSASGRGVNAEAFVGGSAASSVEASDRLRERERRLAEARDEQEREAIRRDTDVFRLNLTFTGEEGSIVRSALGGTPAVRLLEWCRAFQARAGGQE
jgi:hypothetical protein